MQSLQVLAQSGLGEYALFGVAAVGLALVIMLLRRSRAAGRFLLSGAGGCAALAAVHWTAVWTGVPLVFNLFTVGAAVLLGLPGVVSLLFVRLILHA